MSNPATLTIRWAQNHQPWTLKLSNINERGFNPFVWGAHATLHIVKSAGKIATVFEALDHTGLSMTEEQRGVIADMSADLVTLAMRFANLYSFDLATRLTERVLEQNKIPIPDWDQPDVPAKPWQRDW